MKSEFKKDDCVTLHIEDIGTGGEGIGKADMVAGQEVPLTALEYRLCLVFAMNRGQLLTRAQILDQLWDQNGNFVEDNTLTVYVKRLREKLGDAVTIETVRGRGYRVGE